jgi:hypothetical protein
MESTNTSDSVNGRLVSKPGIPTKATLGPGVHTVGADGLLLVPRTAQSVTMPLIVILHGAGRTAGDIFVRDAVTRADVRADDECPCHGKLASVLQRLRPLRFIKFALRGDHTLEHVSTTIDAVMVDTATSRWEREYFRRRA